MSQTETSAHDQAGAASDSGRTNEQRQLPAAAKRALAEAEARRAARAKAAEAAPKEIGGKQGPDPARYGDWEKDGIISDF